jgi:hypothetical protein
MGHRDVKTAMHYQPELQIVRAALDYRPPKPEITAQQARFTTPFATPEKPQPRQVIEHAAR